MVESCSGVVLVVGGKKGGCVAFGVEVLSHSSGSRMFLGRVDVCLG